MRAGVRMSGGENIVVALVLLSLIVIWLRHLRQ